MFFDPNNLWTPVGGAPGGLLGGSGYQAGFTVYLPTSYVHPLPGPKLTALTNISSSSSGGIFTPPDSGEVAEIWGHGTLFFGGDQVNTSLDVSGIGSTISQVTRNPILMILIVSAIFWFFYLRKKK